MEYENIKEFIEEYKYVFGLSAIVIIIIGIIYINNKRKNLDDILKEYNDYALTFQENIEGNTYNSDKDWGQHKLENLNKLGKNCENFLEVGFNAGHSCAAVLYNNPNIKNVLIFDINHHKYTYPCFEKIKKDFPNINFEFIPGDSTKTIPDYDSNIKYDFIHIDGGHTKEIAKSDIVNCKKFITDNGILLIDDCIIDERPRESRKPWEVGVYDAVKESINSNLIELIRLPTDKYSEHTLARYI